MKNKKLLTILGLGFILLVGNFSYSKGLNDNNKSNDVKFEKLNSVNLNSKISLENAKQTILTKFPNSSILGIRVKNINSKVMYEFGLEKDNEFTLVSLDANSGELKEEKLNQNKKDRNFNNKRLDKKDTNRREKINQNNNKGIGGDKNGRK